MRSPWSASGSLETTDATTILAVPAGMTLYITGIFLNCASDQAALIKLGATVIASATLVNGAVHNFVAPIHPDTPIFTAQGDDLSITCSSSYLTYYTIVGYLDNP